MPLPALNPVEPRAQDRAIDTPHHFDVAYGDVAALHARIEQSFRDAPLALLPSATTPARLDRAVRAVSRMAGPATLIATIAGIMLVLF